MFGKSQNKAVAETAAPTAQVSAPEIEDIEKRRAAAQAEVDTIQKRVDETDRVVRDLQEKVSKEVRMGHPMNNSDPRAIELKEARDHFKKLCAQRDEKVAGLDVITRQIRNKACEPLMRELETHVRKAAALFAQALEPNARAHTCVQQLLELGAEIPEVFIRGLSIATFGPTDYSRFCDACAQAEIEIEKPAADIPHIPPPASHHFRQHADANYAMRLASNAAGHTASGRRASSPAGRGTRLPGRPAPFVLILGRRGFNSAKRGARDGTVNTWGVVLVLLAAPLFFSRDPQAWRAPGLFFSPS